MSEQPEVEETGVGQEGGTNVPDGVAMGLFFVGLVSALVFGQFAMDLFPSVITPIAIFPIWLSIWFGPVVLAERWYYAE